MASAPSPPTPPDPVTTATAQAQANAGTATAQTALNNANVVTPLGSSTYNVTGSQSYQNPDGSWSSVPTYTNTQTLSPAEQGIFNQQTGLASQENTIAKGALNHVASSLMNPLTGENLAPLTTSVGAGPTLQQGYNSGGSIQNLYDLGGAIQSSVPYSYASTSANQNTNAPTTFGDAGPIQGGVSLNASTPTSFAAAGPIQMSLGNTDFTTATNNATNAVLQRLQPTVNQENNALNSQLANQGVMQNSAAWNAAQQQQAQQINDLDLGAVATGDAEQQALFNEANAAGNFANSAQQQQFNQNQAQGLFGMQATAQNNAALLDEGNFANTAQQQNYEQQLGRGQFAQAGVGQNNAAALNEANYGLAATGANNTAALNAGMFGNAAQIQGNQENQGAAQFYDAAQAQANQENQAAATFGNAAADQQYQNQIAGATFGNQATAQQLQQQLALKQAPINEISALVNGGQATLPQFAGYQGGQVGTTPISADTYQSASLAEQNYMAQAQMAGQENAGLFGLGGALLGGITKLSDRRLKTNVMPIGTWANGLMVYAYDMIGTAKRQIGFMADEVARLRPEAVTLMPHGFWSVDYEMAVR